ncbi:hypothetical protein OIDMADRAFT_185280 [Oidiodendron maius Zn]|uniref:Uncharacterized protein n=1 Tax=Oidiodendron maius (strain Zn) TaxID=913774 RepID=A0A0C3HXJ6_OIDMZ|nr:hypothetical protein OIDMADRAFT_185280 [Oidiodendron maius Zn]
MHSQFTVKSSCLCYGDLHNIWIGACSPIQGFPNPAPEISGTVRAHKLEYNVSALNGTWKTFHLVDIGSQIVRAWFACHSSVNPEKEIDKILRVSGSPYELESGSNVNNAETAAEGVLVINRYDWGYYDQRGMADAGDAGDVKGLGKYGHCVGLVDRENAKEQALQWKGHDNAERHEAEAGVWLYIPYAEYLFGRFGFDEEHAAARSFLFFTESTYFMHTGFQGMSYPLRKEESPEEIFTRHLNSGEQFDGFDIMRKLYSWVEYPAESDCLGPFNTSESLLEESDWDALRMYTQKSREEAKVRTFGEPLKEPIFALLNNLALTCLMRFIEPISSADSIQAVATTLCPKHAEGDLMDKYLYECLVETKDKIIPDFDVAAIESRIKGFLFRQCGDNALLNDSEFIGRVRQYLTFPLKETLELAGNRALDGYHANIVTSDIRLAICQDPALTSLFKFCKVLWYGTN